ncbi:MAG: HD domain-containing phosphohydrolase [Candidatus Saccharicenans sp.]
MEKEDFKKPHFRAGDKAYILGLKEELYRVLVEESREGFYIIGPNGFEYVNPALAKMLELSPEEIISLKVEDFLKQVYPEDREIILERREARRSGRSVAPVYRLRVFTKTGRLIHLEFHTPQIAGERVAGVVREVTEEVKVEEELREREILTDNLLNNMRTPVVIVQDGKFKFANQAASEIFGFSPEEIIGAHYSDFLDEQQKEKIEELYQKAISGGPLIKHFELEVPRKDGRKLWIGVDVSLINYRGASAALTVIYDLTYRKEVEKRLSRTLEQLRGAFGAVIEVLHKLIDYKDPYTGGHQKRVADLARAIASEMGLPADRIEGLRLAAQIHDIGKIVVPSEILSKPGKLNSSEWGLVKNHVQIGYDLLKEIDFPWPVAEIVYQHHERINGSGYPRGLKGDEIKLEARILAVADVIEAISSHRPYREAFTLEEALTEIENGAGVLYDQKVVEACVRLFREKGYKWRS